MSCVHMVTVEVKPSGYMSCRTGQTESLQARYMPAIFLRCWRLCGGYVFYQVGSHFNILGNVMT